MNVVEYLHPEDAQICRTESVIVLRDSDGEEIMQFPPEWSNEQIELAIQFANKTYREGFDLGRENKAREVRKALNID